MSTKSSIITVRDDIEEENKVSIGDEEVSIGVDIVGGVGQTIDKVGDEVDIEVHIGEIAGGERPVDDEPDEEIVGELVLGHEAVAVGHSGESICDETLVEQLVTADADALADEIGCVSAAAASSGGGAGLLDAMELSVLVI